MIEYKIVWIISGLIMFIGILLIIVGLIKWYHLQQLDDRYKKTDTEMKIADAKKKIIEMSDM